MSDPRLSPSARQLQHLVALAAAEALPDAALLERFTRRRDEGAFAALVRRHGPMVLRVCRRVVGCDAHLPEWRALAISGPIETGQGKAGVTFWDIATGKMVRTLAIPGGVFGAGP